MRKRILTENRLKMESACERVAECLDGIHSRIQFVSEEPLVKEMDASARKRVRWLFDHEWETHRSSEVSIVERDFDGARPPFMTFVRGAETHDEEEAHSPEREKEKCQVLIEQIKRFAADPSLKAQISREIRLGLGEEPEGARRRGFVYSVPVRRDGDLVAIVAATAPSEILSEEIGRGTHAGMALLANERGDVYSCPDLPEEIRAWFLERFRGQGVSGFFAEAPEIFRIGKWSALWTPLDVRDDQRWRLAFLYDETAYPGRGAVADLLSGWGTAAAILLTGVILALLARSAHGRLAERVGFLRELERHDRMLRSIVEGTSETSGGEFFRSLVRHLAAALGVRCALLGEIIGPRRERVRTLAVWSGDGFAENFEYELAGTPCENVVDRQLCLYPEGAHQRFPGDRFLREMGAESYVGTLVKDARGKATAILAVLDDKPVGDRSKHARSLLTIFAARAGMEIERKRSEEQIRIAHKRLQAVDRIGTLAGGSLDLEEVLNRILEGALEASGASVGMIYLKDPGSGCFRLAAAQGVSGTLVDEHRKSQIGPGEGLTGRIAQSGKAIFVRENVAEDPRLARSAVPVAKGEQLNSFVGVPILAGDEAIGVLNLSSRRPDVLDEENITLAAAIGAHVGSAVRNARLFFERTRLATAIEQAAETIVITDLNGSIQYVNPAFEKTTGYQREEAIGRNPRILQSGKHDAEFYRELWDALPRGEVWRGRFTNKRKDGSLYEEEATITPIRGARGEIINYVAVKRDVTREAELEARLRQTQKMEAIGTLAGGIAHDFNNILSAILGYADLAIQDAGDSQSVCADIREVIKAGKRAADLVAQILAFSRQAEQDQRPMRLQEVVHEALDLLRGTLPSTIEIREDIDPDCGPMIGDPTRVHQVVINLCTNAFHAMREKGGVLEVGVQEIGPTSGLDAAPRNLLPHTHVCLTVRDTGCGMDAATLERIFDPYFTTKKVGEGTGLGLATVHGIVAQHHGAIIVDSRPGKGAAFRIFFPLHGAPPLAAQEAAGPPEDSARPPLLAKEGERVLLVDDETVIVDVGRTSLERLGYRVTGCAGSIEALEAFRARPDEFDVVVTNQTMPALTGIELAEEILRIRPDIPIILCTGFSEIVDEQKAKARGIREYAMKPIVADDLAKTIRRVLDDESSHAPLPPDR
jgi:PAS domain S-box-containing protein